MGYYQKCLTVCTYFMITCRSFFLLIVKKMWFQVLKEHILYSQLSYWKENTRIHYSFRELCHFKRQVFIAHIQMSDVFYNYNKFKKCTWSEYKKILENLNYNISLNSIKNFENVSMTIQKHKILNKSFLSAQIYG